MVIFLIIFLFCFVLLGNTLSLNGKEPEEATDETAGPSTKNRTSLSSDEVEIIGAIPKDRSRRYIHFNPDQVNSKNSTQLKLQLKARQ